MDVRTPLLKKKVTCLYRKTKKKRAEISEVQNGIKKVLLRKRKKEKKDAVLY